VNSNVLEHRNVRSATAWRDMKIGQISGASTFSLHPGKPAGGRRRHDYTTDDAVGAENACLFCNRLASPATTVRARKRVIGSPAMKYQWNWGSIIVSVTSTCALGISQPKGIAVWTRRNVNRTP